MKQINLSRNNAYKLIKLVRDMVEKEINLSECLPDNTNMEKTEVSLQGISNGFLSEIIHTITGYEVEVFGEVEELYPCPCCGFKTLTEYFDAKEGTGYDICPYCHWEDDGTTETKSYRSINKGSIEDYRKKMRANFNKYYISKWIREDIKR